MRAGARAAAAAAAGWLAAACALGTPRRREPPDPDLRIWAPVVIHWAPGARRTFPFAIENATQRTLDVGDPEPGRAGVAIFLDAGPSRACGVEAGDPVPGGTASLAPGDQLAVQVDLADACRDLLPGEYRYELSYRVPGAGGRGAVSLLTRYGTLVVEGPARASARGGSSPSRPPLPGP